MTTMAEQRMSTGERLRAAWPWLRILVGVGIVGALVTRLNTHTFADGLRAITPGAVLAALAIGMVTTVLCAGGLITGLGLLLIVAAWTEDAKIDRHTGYTSAKVVSVTFQRTLVKFQTPDGAEHIPSVGVLYPEQLEEGQVVSVEYDQTNPELVRVAGRGASVTLLPVGSTVLVAWVVVLPLLWWLRSRAFRV